MGSISRTVLWMAAAIALLLQSGCVSYYNHGRVQDDLIKKNAVRNNDIEVLKYIVSGSTPKEALKQKKQALQLRALETNGEVDGLAFAFEPLEIGNYWTTFKAAPVTSSLSLLADGAVIYGLNKLRQSLGNSSSGDSSRDNVTISAEGNISISGTDINSTTDNTDNSSDNSVFNPVPAE